MPVPGVDTFWAARSGPMKDGVLRWMEVYTEMLLVGMIKVGLDPTIYSHSPVEKRTKTRTERNTGRVLYKAT